MDLKFGFLKNPTQLIMKSSALGYNTYQPLQPNSKINIEYLKSLAHQHFITTSTSKHFLIFHEISKEKILEILEIVKSQEKEQSFRVWELDFPFDQLIELKN